MWKIVPFHVSLALLSYQDSSVGKVSDSGVVGRGFLRTSLLPYAKYMYTSTSI